MKWMRLACIACCAIDIGCAGTRSLVPAPPSFADLARPSASSSADLAKPRMYVVNSGANSVTVYNRTLTGDIAPLRTIKGAATGLNHPQYVALDASGHEYVTNAGANSVTVFASNAAGNAKPIATLAGGLTQLTNPSGIALDSSGRIYVADFGSSGGYITVYRKGANGDAAPVQTISDTIGFFSIAGIAIHGSTLYVSNTDFNFNTQISEYPTSANGVTSPSAVIGGLGAPVGVAVESNGKIVVVDGNAVKVFAANANGNPTPLQTISGPHTALSNPMGVAVGSAGIYVADSGTPAVTSYTVGANGNATPLTDVTGAMTMLNAPVGIAIR